MKKTFSTLLFAFALTSSAYAQELFPELKGQNGLWLDSIVVTYEDGTHASKEIIEYNSDKQPICFYEYVYNVNQELIPSTRTDYVYNEDKNFSLEEYYVYDQEKGEFFLNEKYEVYQWNELSKIPATIYISTLIDETDPEAGVQLQYKQMWTDFNEEGYPVDCHYYAIVDGQETDSLVAKAHMDYYENGLTKKEITSLITTYNDISFTLEQSYEYEYDQHDNLTKATYIKTTSMGIPPLEEVTNYVNEYDEDGNLETVQISYSSSEPSGKRDEIWYYYWGDGTATLIRALNAARMNNIFFDLSGRQHQGTPTEKGIYIVNGKKIVIN